MQKKDPTSSLFYRRFLVIIAIIIIFALVYLARGLFIYVALGILLAFVLDLPIRFLNKRLKIPKVAGTIISIISFYLLFISAIMFLIPNISSDIGALITNINTEEFSKDFDKNMKEVLMPLSTWLGDQYAPENINATLIEQLKKVNIGQIIQKVFTGGLSAISSISGLLAGLVFVPILTFYFVVDAPKFKQNFIRLFPSNRRRNVDEALFQVGRALGAYVRGQIILCLAIGFLSFLALTILGIPYAFLLAFIAGLTEFIPLVGPTIGLIPAAIVALIKLGWIKALWVVASYMIIQLLENNFLVPRIMSKEMDIHPVTVMLGMMLGAQLAGIMGMFLALPLVTVVKILFLLFLYDKDAGVGFEKIIGDIPIAGSKRHEPIRAAEQALIDINVIATDEEIEEEKKKPEPEIKTETVDTETLPEHIDQPKP